jgi:glutathione synthase/RimK-type ligase-like ATP-grasp enzyme
LPRVALLTDRQRPASTHDDRLLIPACAAIGIEAKPAIWDEAVDWRAVDAVVVRSTWDYHTRIEAFEAWIAAREGEGTRLFNPPDVLRWNARKSYLDDLGRRGVPVIPTARWPEHTVGACLEKWPEIVVKPEVSGAGKDTFRVTAENAAKVERRLERAGGAFLVQPYLRAIETAGETSFVFLDGAFSHAIRKTASRGKWLIHEEHGGSLRVTEPGPELVASAARAVAAVGEGLLYARVDAIVDGEKLWLVELEVLEPELFFRFRPEAAGVMAEAIRRRVTPRS